MMSTSFTGTRTIPVDDDTTDRQYQIYQEDLLKKEMEKKKKAMYRADLKRQQDENRKKKLQSELLID